MTDMNAQKHVASGADGVEVSSGQRTLLEGIPQVTRTLGPLFVGSSPHSDVPRLLGFAMWTAPKHYRGRADQSC